MPPTLSQDLSHKLAALDALDAANSCDKRYAEVFSTFVKVPLKRNETWRMRLVRWIEQEKRKEQNQWR